MVTVYTVGESGKVRALDEVKSTNEEKDLQKLLSDNPELLVGDQIDPDAPRRWLQIKSEMPVSDPTTGTDRWSIDLLFVDQDAVLTMVECKRCDDTRSRREVIAQVLEYAANAHIGWSPDLLRRHAAKTAVDAGSTLEKAIARLAPSEEVGATDLFEAALTNLRNRVCRIVLFLDRAPTELKSLVEFLNAECATIEILLVEARFYGDPSSQGRFVAPALWGFTEQIRLQKERMTEAVSGRQKRWTKDGFVTLARSADPAMALVLEEVLESCGKAGCNVTWGTGRQATFNVRVPGITDLSAITVYCNGDLIINFSSLSHNEEEQLLRQRLAKFVTDEMRLDLPADYEKLWPRYKFEQWSPRRAALIAAVSPRPV